MKRSRSSPQPAEAPVLTFYFRQDCHLCEDMWQQLMALPETALLQFERVDVDSRPELTASFGTLVPVLALGDRIICNYYLDPVALKEQLRNSEKP